MELRPQAIGQDVEQTIMYIQRALSFIPGVVYSQQFATPEDRLRAICEAVQNDAVLLQQARIKIEQMKAVNSELQQDMTILQAERDQARIEMQQVKRELESYKQNATAPPAQIIPLPTPPAPNSTSSAQTAIENEPAACARCVQLESEQKARTALERSIQLAKDENHIMAVRLEEYQNGSGVRLLQEHLASSKQSHTFLHERLRIANEENSIIRTKLQESEDQKANMAEKLMEAKAAVTDVASEIEMLKSAIEKIKEHQSKTKAALKGRRVLDLSLRLEELQKQSLDMQVELRTKDQKCKQVLEGKTCEIEDMVRAKDQMRTFLQVVQSRADQLLDAIEMARTMVAHQDLIMKEWQDRTEASESRVKELDTELEESKGKYSELEIRWQDVQSRTKEMATFVAPAMQMPVVIALQEHI
ncbi:hypothetical protein BG005_009582 [Podila minutissima]|nr:hypothetical protein BG005_009582 [Podila minutissima]